MSKRILILQACGNKNESLECDNIKTHAKHYGMHVDNHCAKTNVELAEILSGILQNQHKYDYIYLSSHGDKDGFASYDGEV